MLNINIGSMYQQLRNPEQALHYYKIAEKIDPSFQKFIITLESFMAKSVKRRWRTNIIKKL